MKARREEVNVSDIDIEAMFNYMQGVNLSVTDEVVDKLILNVMLLSIMLYLTVDVMTIKC